MQLKAIIVEDEANSREILGNYIQKYCPGIEVTGEAANIEDALILIKKNQPELVFLDVEMPFGNAFDLLEKIGTRDFDIIFVTAYDHYAKDALNHHASYYLTKPISIDELIKATDYVLETRRKEDSLSDKILTSTRTINGKITIPQLDGFEVIEIANIQYCKADDNYTEIHLENKKILVSKTLKYFEEALSDFPFARIHKSYLVNVGSIVKYKKGKGGSVLLNNGKELLVSASRKQELLSFF
ncbi:LytR/AlgR family response regulator transcription factor [Ascidiimonas sp. W6]|uniref:LytR/AlgR family response regulator transcription factor n=1 Tax=Ascidiimonas meishanensis TaxID=3128903 RepID=UPI0030EF38F5